MATGATSELAVAVHRFSLEEYHQMVESGGFDEDTRVELIEGMIVDMSPKSKEHENVIAWLAEWLTLAVDRRRFQVRTSAALTLERSEPEPDLSVIRRDAPRAYHPSTAALVIEIAVSSQRRDLHQKPSLYARAGIEEYWVIDLDARRAVVHGNPAGDRYESVTEVGAQGNIVAQALALPSLALGELLAAAER